MFVDLAIYYWESGKEEEEKQASLCFDLSLSMSSVSLKPYTWIVNKQLYLDIMIKQHSAQVNKLLTT